MSSLWVPRNGRARIYAALTVIGFVVPNVFVAVYFSRHGSSRSQYFRDWFGTVPASQITLDLTIAGVTFLIWAFFEARKAGVRLWWLVFPATALVGFCMAVPLFLYLREQSVPDVAGGT